MDRRAYTVDDFRDILHPFFGGVLEIRQITQELHESVAWKHLDVEDTLPVQEQECVALLHGVPVFRGYVAHTGKYSEVGFQHTDALPPITVYKMVKAVLNHMLKRKQHAVALVDAENEIAKAFVERLGFIKQYDIIQEGFVFYILESSDSHV